MSLTVIVCTYRRTEQLEQCLNSLVAQEDPGMQVIAVVVRGDNNSRRIVADRGLEAVVQDGYGGIAEARNLGIRQADGELVAFIDDDARARPGWARSLSGGFDTRSVGGVGGPVIDTRSGEQVVHEWWVDPYGVTHLTSEPTRAVSRTPTLNGCNMAFRRDALLRIGGFDPYYRYYFDETDVCARLVRAGYRVRFCPDAIVDHDFADGPTRERFLYHSSRMRAYFSLKNFRDSVRITKLLASQVRLLREDLRAFRRGRAQYAGPAGILRACREVLQGRGEGILHGLYAARLPIEEVTV